MADDGLTLAGLHLGNLAFEQDLPADDLAVEVPVVLRPPRGLPDHGERLQLDDLHLLAVGQALSQLVGLVAQRLRQFDSDLLHLDRPLVLRKVRRQFGGPLFEAAVVVAAQLFLEFVGQVDLLFVRLDQSLVARADDLANPLAHSRESTHVYTFMILPLICENRTHLDRRRG